MISSEEIYQQSLDFAAGLFEKGLPGKTVKAADVRSQVDTLIQGVLQKETEFLMLTGRSSSGNYLLAHSVNCTILSIVVGLALKYSRENLQKLAAAAFLHDAGMMSVRDLAEKPGRLSKEEYQEIKRHVLTGPELLEKVGDLDSLIIQVASDHHERPDGSGYPRELKEGEIHEFSLIVGLADVYEALTHPRSYRKEIPPFEAVKQVLQSKKLFSQKVLKALLERISIYPVGTYVEINTKAVGKVVSVNAKFPMRPCVQIMMDHDRVVPTEPALLDLTSDVNLYIHRCLTAQEVLELAGPHP